MTSPFPGMDPYLEQHWRDVHSRLVIYSCDAMQAQLPEELFARVEERVYVESPLADDRVIYPDVRVVQHRPGSTPGGAAATLAEDVDIAESWVIKPFDEDVTETFIEIREASASNRLITVIEFLSPANKVKGEGQEQYVQKQKELRQAGVSLVEIDLVRTGKPTLTPPPERVPPAEYRAIVRRGWDPPPVARYYVLPLRQRLGGIRIPLRQTDAEVTLRLQELIDQCYRNGRYHTIDYRVDPVPPLTGADVPWADALLRATGKRQ
jgi:hypothetical protein